LLKKFFDESLADKAGAACDEYVHGFLLGVAFRVWLKTRV
jgi:hypothetical protein